MLTTATEINDDYNRIQSSSVVVRQYPYLDYREKGVSECKCKLEMPRKGSSQAYSDFIRNIAKCCYAIMLRFIQRLPFVELRHFYFIRALSLTANGTHRDQVIRN